MGDSTYGKQHAAVLDHWLTTNVVLSDEEAYRSKGLSSRMGCDPYTIRLLLTAALLFDTVYSEPIMLVGLEDILGLNFFELFENTFLKLRKAGFVDFSLESLVPPEKKDEMRRVLSFLAEVHKGEAEYRVSQGLTRDIWRGSQEAKLVMSKYVQLPFFTSACRVNPPTASQDEQPAPQFGPFRILEPIMEIELPMLEVKSLDEVLEIRKTAGAREFREVVHTIWDKLQDSIVEGPDAVAQVATEWTRIKNEAVDLLVAEFKSEISGWSTAKGGASVLLDVAGFIPGISIVTGALATAKDAKELYRQISTKHRARSLSFLSFISDVRRRVK